MWLLVKRHKNCWLIHVIVRTTLWLIHFNMGESTSRNTLLMSIIAQSYFLLSENAGKLFNPQTQIQNTFVNQNLGSIWPQRLHWEKKREPESQTFNKRHDLDAQILKGYRYQYF